MLDCRIGAPIDPRRTPPRSTAKAASRVAWPIRWSKSAGAAALPPSAAARARHRRAPSYLVARGQPVAVVGNLLDRLSEGAPHHTPFRRGIVRAIGASAGQSAGSSGCGGPVWSGASAASPAAPVMMLPRRGDRRHEVGRRDDPERAKCRPHCVGYVGRRQVAVVLFDHAGVCMS
jgi:hypothetical protein